MSLCITRVNQSYSVHSTRLFLLMTRPRSVPTRTGRSRLDPQRAGASRASSTGAYILSVEQSSRMLDTEYCERSISQGDLGAAARVGSSGTVHYATLGSQKAPYIGPLNT